MSIHPPQKFIELEIAALERQVDPEELSYLKAAFDAAAYTDVQQKFLLWAYVTWNSGLLNGLQITLLAQLAGMIEDFSSEKVRPQGGVHSHGLSECTYDLRLGRHFQFYNDNDTPLDPDDFDQERDMTRLETDRYVLEKRGGFVLAVAFEKIKIPPFIVPILVNKSSWKRLGLCSSGDTLLNPGHDGPVTLELTNLNDRRDLVLKEGVGIVSLLFEKMSMTAIRNYSNGRYSGQTPANGVTRVSLDL